MRILLFSSQIFNILNYALGFSNLDHEFITTPLVPSCKRKEFENKIALFRGSKLEKLRIFPIFLETSERCFRNYLNPISVTNDLLSIFKALTYIKPTAIICSYVLDALPLVMLKRIFNYSLYVVASGGDVNLHEGILYRLVRKLIYSHSDLIFAVSNELKHKIQRESGYEAIVIPPGVDPAFFRPLNLKASLREKWGFKEKAFVVLTVCELVKHKGLDIIMKSISISNHRLRDCIKLAIVGEGPEKPALEQLASKLNLKENTIFLGFRSREELLELYNLADLFVLASYSEGMPFVLLEAMACGCVCISTNVGDISRAIIDGYNGFLIMSGDPEALAKKIERVLSPQKENIFSFRNRARSTILNNFDFRHLIRNMIELISIKESRLHAKESLN